MLNKVDFGLPYARFNSSTFGQITSQYNLPRNIQLALKVHFLARRAEINLAEA